LHLGVHIELRYLTPRVPDGYANAVQGVVHLNVEGNPLTIIVELQATRPEVRVVHAGSLKKHTSEINGLFQPDLRTYPFHEAREVATHGPGATSGCGKVAGYPRHHHPVRVKEAGIPPGLRKELQCIMNQVVEEGAWRFIAFIDDVVPLSDVSIRQGVLQN